MFHSIDGALGFIRDKKIAMIDLKFCDLWGRWRHVTLPATRFGPELLADGVGFDGSSLGLASVKSGDLVMVPELATGFMDPFWEVPTLSFLGASLEADTREPFAHDPRTVASRAEAFLKASGVGDRSLWGPEFEFSLFDGVSYENGVNAAAYRVESQEADWKSQQLGSGYTIPLNAVKFTALGHIEVRIESEAGLAEDGIQLCVSVRDTGAGIPADKLPQIFDKFTQADGSISRRFGGSANGFLCSACAWAIRRSAWPSGVASCPRRS